MVDDGHLGMPDTSKLLGPFVIPDQSLPARIMDRSSENPGINPKRFDMTKKEDIKRLNSVVFQSDSRRLQ